ncbi:Pheromone shutdown [Macleaya cordata]|uniref:Pheromone shutdown n=1 Tax=Macleaya cordata TaxID=56857 RepID=A0A200R0A7_MACCD|nr:Pheromone shutdown [Macleaya cordata]
METLTSLFTVFSPNKNPNNLQRFIFLKSHLSNFPKSLAIKNPKVSIKPPPPEFDFRSEISKHSLDIISEKHPELLDLVERGNLVLIQKSLFGPVPIWRTEFMEPEEIWLIGTNHISQESAVDVERVVRAVKPDNVVVELCRSRQEAGIMYVSNEREPGPNMKSNMFSLSGSGFFGAIGRSINLGGQTALALRLLLAVLSSKVSSEANQPFGNEFRAARKASEEIGAQLVLGDRPIEITLERAWNSLGWNEKLSLVALVFRGLTSPLSATSQSNLKDPDKDDSPFQLYEQLSFSYPSLLQPLIHERDTYLAWSLKRSKAVNNCKRVVGVIGKGHMNGVIYALVSDLGDLRFRDLVGKRPFGENSNGWIQNILKDLVRDTIIGILLWFLYEQLKTVLQ